MKNKRNKVKFTFDENNENTLDNMTKRPKGKEVEFTGKDGKTKVVFVPEMETRCSCCGRLY